MAWNSKFFLNHDSLALAAGSLYMIHTAVTVDATSKFRPVPKQAGAGAQDNSWPGPSVIEHPHSEKEIPEDAYIFSSSTLGPAKFGLHGLAVKDSTADL